MNLKFFGVLAASTVAVAVTAASPAVVPAVPGAAACQRLVAIESQVTAAEGDGTLGIAVSSHGCAAPGQVSYVITDGSAHRPSDFTGGNGQLQFAAGDTTTKTIRVRLTADPTPETPLEDFTVTLVNPGPGIAVTQAVAQARIGDSSVSWLSGDDRICPMEYDSSEVQPSPPPLSIVCTYENDNVVFWARFSNSNPLVPHSARLVSRPGSLRAGEHFQPVDTTLNFLPGQSVRYVRVTVRAGVPGHFSLELSGPDIADTSSVMTLTQPG